MKKAIIAGLSITCLIFALSGCTQSPWLYRVNIQQGNIITPEMVHELHVGMSKEKVYDIMGSPVLLDTFNDNRWAYIYTFKAGRGHKYEHKHLTIYFRNNKICKMVTKNV